MAVVPRYRLQHRDRMVTPKGIASSVPILFWFQIKMLAKVKYFIHHNAVALFRLAGQSFPTDFYVVADPGASGAAG